MDTIRIATTDGKQLLFQGKLIARSSSEQLFTPAGTRVFDLRVYACQRQGFVPMINYFTSHANERDVVIAELVDDANDVQNFFLVFEPYEVINANRRKSMSADEREHLSQSLVELYDTQLSQLLLAAKHELLRGSPSKTFNRSDASRTKKGLLDFFGLR